MSDDGSDVVSDEVEQAATIEAAYRRDRVALVRLAYMLCGSRELAEDVVHTVFAEVQERWFRIDDSAAYLRRAVVNRVRDAQRRQYRTRALPTPPEPVTGDTEVDETWAVVQTLTPVQRAVVVLRFYEDLSLVEIARLLDRREATVRSDLRRGLRHLERKLR